MKSSWGRIWESLFDGFLEGLWLKNDSYDRLREIMFDAHNEHKERYKHLYTTPLTGPSGIICEGNTVTVSDWDANDLGLAQAIYMDIISGRCVQLDLSRPKERAIILDALVLFTSQPIEEEHSCP